VQGEQSVGEPVKAEKAEKSDRAKSARPRREAKPVEQVERAERGDRAPRGRGKQSADAKPVAAEGVNRVQKSLRLMKMCSPGSRLII
jgi:hypothetical protein